MAKGKMARKEAVGVLSHPDPGSPWAERLGHDVRRTTVGRITAAPRARSTAQASLRHGTTPLRILLMQISKQRLVVLEHRLRRETPAGALAQHLPPVAARARALDRAEEVSDLVVPV